ncbi:neuronal calcium sensor 2 isoform X3 [Eurytemora carolleeae]|uniref:neuronal calcium sensor 2 isoform X3 n=1 Tax=Eurytemora carolleeae TaxID=1294199 RepID=UPI000C7921F1|nr:neuronal calcium sensor 2 isoform X3 [Eurytemora carolleeae]|eukprot:XP_023335011.1 neuronal calcium sensor 2-like isoform X3 [Eurytemora affinis]
MSKMSGKRFKKKTGTKSAKNLPKTDLDWLSKNTHFSPANIVEWHKGFLDDCPDGRMNRDKMKEMFNAITPQDADGEGKSGEQFLDQLFRIFDKDGDGSIDFKEFMIATDMSSREFIFQEFMIATDMSSREFIFQEFMIATDMSSREFIFQDFMIATDMSSRVYISGVYDCYRYVK